jgi:hypothetical protein
LVAECAFPAYNFCIFASFHADFYKFGYLIFQRQLRNRPNMGITRTVIFADSKNINSFVTNCAQRSFGQKMLFSKVLLKNLKPKKAHKFDSPF